MSHLAKSNDPARQHPLLRRGADGGHARRSSPILVAWRRSSARGPCCSDIRHGFTDVLVRGAGVRGARSSGVLSQGTGVFGGLILLDHRENTFCVPVNRASSVARGRGGHGTPLRSGSACRAWGSRELLGAVCVMAAMLVLGLPTVLKARRAAPPASPELKADTPER